MSGTDPGIERVAVPLGPRSYEVVVGDGLLDRAAALLDPVLGSGRRLVVVTDETVAGLHLDRLQAGLGRPAPVVTVPPGEGAKSWAGLERLVDQLLALGIDRGAVILALGGGVVGDLAGFAAAILLRGIDFVQLPTTLLAQVDSSVGGKTAINTAAGKNLVGSFHQPRLVLADIGTLATLPVREVRAGYAEVVKHAVIADAAFFAWLEAHGAALVAGDAAARRVAVLHSCRTKAGVVAADEREAGLRALLNFGHTFGHALEAETGFGARLLHGEAVAIGMGLALDLSRQLSGCPAAAAERLRRHLADVGAPSRLADVPGAPLAADALVHHMWGDKKTRDGALTFVLARDLGDAVVRPGVPPEAVRAILLQAGAT